MSKHMLTRCVKPDMHSVSQRRAQLLAALALCALLSMIMAPRPAPAAEDDTSKFKAKDDKGKTLMLDLGGGVKMELVKIEAGEFMMGSPGSESKRYADEKQHKVKIAKAFHMGVYEVTQGQYKAITSENSSHFKGDDLPVETVSWDDAVAFCRKLSEKTGKKVRLPTEAEWEYACRAGTTTPFHFGDTISAEEANYNGDVTYGAGVTGTYRKKTIAVGSLKSPNSWGLHDMHGNVWEWCSSKYADYPYRADDGREEASGTAPRVLHGGAWTNYPDRCRAANRHKNTPDRRVNVIGFRLVLDSSE